MTKLYDAYKWVARGILIALVTSVVVAGVVTLTGCSSIETTSQEEVTPIPVPTVDYKKEILGQWEGINSQNIECGIRFEFMPNGNLYLQCKSNDIWVDVPTNSTYNVYDNKILHVVSTVTIKEGDGPTVIEEFWHITINGKVMYLSAKKIGKDDVSYVVTLTMKKIK